LALLGQDAINVISSNIAAIVPAGQTSVSILYLSGTLAKHRQKFQAEVFQIPQQRQAPQRYVKF
jgi:hypothetical protein